MTKDKKCSRCKKDSINENTPWGLCTGCLIERKLCVSCGIPLDALTRRTVCVNCRATGMRDLAKFR